MTLGKAILSGTPTGRNPPSDKEEFSDVRVEHLKTWCQELTGSLLDRHQESLKRNGMVKISLELPDATEELILVMDENGLLISGSESPLRRAVITAYEKVAA